MEWLRARRDAESATDRRDLDALLSGTGAKHCLLENRCRSESLWALDLSRRNSDCIRDGVTRSPNPQVSFDGGGPPIRVS